MTAGNHARRRAFQALSLFADGSLVLVDDSLSVNGGGTVDLRVRLGAKPRSDVTVALSETSALISLATDSIVFTPDNWDTFQSVTVTAGGNRQAFSLPSNNWQFVQGQRGWSLNPQLPIIAGLTAPGAATTLLQFAVRTSGEVVISTLGGVDELSDMFESSGSAALTVGSTSWVFDLAGADTSEPYEWSPTNSADVSAAYAALESAVAGALVLRDYTPGDATVSLSASGPSEYDNVDATATVTVN